MTTVTQHQHDNARYIAGLIGPVSVVAGASMLINPDVFLSMIGQLSGNTMMIFIAGMIALTIGIAILKAYRVWDGSWRVLITIFGWLSVFGGLVRMLAPEQTVRLAETIVGPNMMLGASLVVIAFGAFLSFKAYAARD